MKQGSRSQISADAILVKAFSSFGWITFRICNARGVACVRFAFFQRIPALSKRKVRQQLKFHFVGYAGKRLVDRDCFRFRHDDLSVHINVGFARWAVVRSFVLHRGVYLFPKSIRKSNRAKQYDRKHKSKCLFHASFLLNSRSCGRSPCRRWH